MINNKNFSIYTPASFPILHNSWKVISLSENDFIKELGIYYQAGKLSAISDIFSINQGALLGVKNIFKIYFCFISTTKYKKRLVAIRRL